MFSGTLRKGHKQKEASQNKRRPLKGRASPYPQPPPVLPHPKPQTPLPSFQIPTPVPSSPTPNPNPLVPSTPVPSSNDFEERTLIKGKPKQEKISKRKRFGFYSQINLEKGTLRKGHLQKEASQNKRSPSEKIQERGLHELILKESRKRDLAKDSEKPGQAERKRSPMHSSDKMEESS
ncbi:coiled-coil domain-containing protein 86-like [Saccostrea cucullata]|uniref:coiled-coil domain-containing protein 86-like n=1 Tax=Saccostrea cuccullata TaxID=36930 RepID=UPI002ED2EBF9